MIHVVCSADGVSFEMCQRFRSSDHLMFFGRLQGKRVICVPLQTGSLASRTFVDEGQWPWSPNMNDLCNVERRGRPSSSVLEETSPVCLHLRVFFVYQVSSFGSKVSFG